MEKVCGVYCIENLINHKKYIGQSIDIYQRWKNHKSDLNNHRHVNDYLQRAWDKYGVDNFTFYILEYCEQSQLDDIEVKYIKEFDTTSDANGYNLNSGGSFGNQIPTEYVRKKMRDNHADISGENNPNYGKHMSDELKKKMIKNRNTVKGENHPNYGKTFSDETKAKLRENHADFSGSKHPRCRSVYCPEFDREFWGAAEVEQEFGIDRTYIYACLSGRQKSAGKHPETGEKLHWYDANEYAKAL